MLMLSSYPFCSFLFSRSLLPTSPCFFFSSMRRHTICALVAGVQTCALPIWLAEDCARLADASHYVTRPEDAWQRLRGLARMDARAQTVAAALAAWRETEAQNRDRPRKWIIDDDAIYRMAERLPDSRAQLEALGTLPPKTVERHGERLLALIAVTREQAAAKLLADDELSGEQKQSLRELQNFVDRKSVV